MDGKGFTITCPKETKILLSMKLRINDPKCPSWEKDVLKKAYAHIVDIFWADYHRMRK